MTFKKLCAFCLFPRVELIWYTFTIIGSVVQESLKKLYPLNASGLLML